MFYAILFHGHVTYGACCHSSFPFSRKKTKNKTYTVITRQEHINCTGRVKLMWEIKKYSVHKLRKSYTFLISNTDIILISSVYSNTSDVVYAFMNLWVV